MFVGYARTSTTDQEAGLAAQERDLAAAGCTKLYAEKVSSVATREKLGAVLDFVRAGDVLHVTKPDRLARSTRELLDIVDGLTAKGVGLVVLSMGGERLDTRNPTAKLMLTILAGVAMWEREIMLERQLEGIAKAKADGKYQGRAPTAMRQAGEVRRLRDGGMGPSDIAKRLGMGRASVYRALAATPGLVDVDGGAVADGDGIRGEHLEA